MPHKIRAESSRGIQNHWKKGNSNKINRGIQKQKNLKSNKLNDSRQQQTIPIHEKSVITQIYKDRFLHLAVAWSLFHHEHVPLRNNYSRKWDFAGAAHEDVDEKSVRKHFISEWELFFPTSG